MPLRKMIKIEFIEVKNKHGKLSKSQEEMSKLFSRLGLEYKVWYSEAKWRIPKSEPKRKPPKRVGSNLIVRI